MIEARCIICGQPCIDHGWRAWLWRSPIRYIHAARWRHFILARLG